MDEDQTHTDVIFETWLYKLRGNAGAKRISLYLTGAWSKKYFILVREGNKPKIFYYSKKPKDYFSAQKGIILLDQHYHVDQKPAAKGKEFVFQLTTAERTVLFALEKEQLYDLLMFFLRTQILLRDVLERECFIVRPEKSIDHRRIGAQSAMCLLHISQWGLTLALQLSKSVLAQWPLRHIRWYECNGRGRFAVETGSQSSTGSGRYVFKTRVGQDSAIYDRIDALVNEQAMNQRMVKPRASNYSSGSETYLSSYGGLDSLTEVMSDSRFICHLKKIAHDIYDHLNEHLGGRSGLVDSWNSTNFTPELLSGERNCLVEPAHAWSLPLTVTLCHDASLRHEGDDVMLTSQYLHMGSPVFDISPFDDQEPSADRSIQESVTLSSKVEQFMETAEDSRSSEVYRSRRGAVGGSSRKHSDRSSSFDRLRLRSLSLDDLSEYVGSTDRAVSYANSVFQDSINGQEASNEVPSGQDETDFYPCSYATTPDFSFPETSEVKPGHDGDGRCRSKSGLLLSKTRSDPNLLEENGVHRRAKSDDKQSKGSRIRSIRHVLIGQNPSNQSAPLQMHSKADDVMSLPQSTDSHSAALSGPCDDAGAARLPWASATMGNVPSLAKGVSVTPKTRVFVKQKVLGSQSPSTSIATSTVSASPSPMSFHTLSASTSSN